MIEVKSELGSVWINPDSIDAVDFQQNAICTVHSGNLKVLISDEDGHALVAKINSEKSAQPDNVQVRAIVSIEKDITYSKSSEHYFDFWRCVMDNGEKVNIFDHPDDSRNTFKIVCDLGWEDWFADTHENSENMMHPPVPVTVSFDGKWYALVSIMGFSPYQDISEIDTTDWEAMADEHSFGGLNDDESDDDATD